MSDFFENRIFKFTDAPRNQPIKFSFKLKEGYTVDDIHYILPGCGSCTTASVDRETNSVVGELDLIKAAGAAGTSALKSITVCFDPQEPESVANENKERITNPNKRKQALQLSGTIID